MKYLKYVSLILASCLALSACSRQTTHIPDKESFVQVSDEDPRYFQLSNGNPYIPVGMNICIIRFETEEEAIFDLMERRFRKLSENGGNYCRIWLSTPFWDVEHEKSGIYDKVKARRLDRLIELARTYGIRLKLCLDHFRTFDDSPPKFTGSVSFGKPIHHVSRGGPAQDVTDFVSNPKIIEQYKGKLKWFKDRYGDEPMVFAWELWNEMNAYRGKGWEEWTEVMLRAGQEIFPFNLVLQSLGGLESPHHRGAYARIMTLPEQRVGQVHRYMNLGAGLEVCHGPMDIVGADAVRELQALELKKPIIHTEAGAVERNHAGPSKLYEVDTEGVLLHDTLFAPFFTGAASPGHPWHWYFYIDRHDLYWHFGRFSEAIKGINPLEENFQTLFSETNHTRNYTLQGRQTTLAWLRDVGSPWQSELAQGNPAEPVENLKVDLLRLGFSPEAKSIGCYLPWEDQWDELSVTNNTVTLPRFVRSVVLKHTQ